jgi:hypothetical protein
MRSEPDDSEFDDEESVDKRGKTRDHGKSVLWYAVAVISVAFIVTGILLANPFIDYQTASTL